MVKNIFLIVCSLCTFNVLISQHNDVFNCGEEFTDPRDGKKYQTVSIGGQCWMAENLNAGITVSNFQQSVNNRIEKTCYQNKPKNCSIYGGLYTWEELFDDPEDRDICPIGWHIPTVKDWIALSEFLGTKMAGQKMKVTKNHDPSWDGNNESKFSAIPSGVGYKDNFGRLGHWAVFWSSDEYNDKYAWFAQLDNFWYIFPPKYKKLYLGNHFMKENGFSVRCLKNK